MARLRVMKQEVTILAEQRGHALFLWRKHPEHNHGRVIEEVPPSFETVCARCAEKFSVESHKRAPYIAGPINSRCDGQRCAAKGECK